MRHSNERILCLFTLKFQASQQNSGWLWNTLTSLGALRERSCHWSRNLFPDGVRSCHQCILPSHLQDYFLHIFQTARAIQGWIWSYQQIKRFSVFYQCRWDISPMCKSPIQTGFDPPDVPCSLQVQNPVIRVLFWLDFQKCSKTCHWHLVKSSKSVWFWRWYSHVSSCLGGWGMEILLFLLIIALIRNPPRAPGRIIHR